MIPFSISICAETRCATNPPNPGTITQLCCNNKSPIKPSTVCISQSYENNLTIYEGQEKELQKDWNLP